MNIKYTREEIISHLTPLANEYLKIGLHDPTTTIQVEFEKDDELSEYFVIKILSDNQAYKLYLLWLSVFISKAKEYVTFINGADVQNFEIVFYKNNTNILLGARIENIE